MNILGVIPARYASTRFPGKPLADIHGKPMVQRVYEQAKKAKLLSDVVVATDDERIRNCVTGFGGRALMTSPDHTCGTERCCEAMKMAGAFDAVINIQGDEPYIDPGQIDAVAGCFSNKDVQIATLIKKLSDPARLTDPNTIKVVINNKKEAMYFSRSPIPFFRGGELAEAVTKHGYYKHIGIYGYRSNVLEAIVKLKPSPLEIAESLEQLRWLENGYRIHVEFTDFESQSVDTPADITRLR